MEIKTTRQIWDKLQHPSFILNASQHQKWIAYNDVEDILNSRLISIRNIILVLGYIKELSNNTLQLRDELEYELQTIKDYLKKLQKETNDDD